MFEEEDSDSVKNVDSGMDICVSTYGEVSGPLGGTSVEYRIRVKTKRPEYRVSCERDVVTFTVHKTFKEIEYFLQKLGTRYADVVTLPKVACEKSPLDEDREMRKKVTNDVLSFVAGHEVLASSAMLFDFLGYQPSRDIDRSSASVTSKAEEYGISTTTTTMTPQEVIDNSDDIFLDVKHGAEPIDDDDDDDDEDLFQEFRRQHVSNKGDSNSSSSPYVQSRFQSRSGEPFLFSGQNALYDDDDENRFAITSSRRMPNDSKAKDDDDDGDSESKLKVDDLETLLAIDDSLSDIWKEMRPKKPVRKGERPSLPPKPTVLPTTKTTNAVKDERPSSSSPAEELPQPVPQPPPPRRASRPPVPTPRRPSASAASSTSGRPETTPSNLTALDILSYIDSEREKQTRDLNLFS